MLAEEDVPRGSSLSRRTLSLSASLSRTATSPFAIIFFYTQTPTDCNSLKYNCHFLFTSCFAVVKTNPIIFIIFALLGNSGGGPLRPLLQVQHPLHLHLHDQHQFHILLDPGTQLLPDCDRKHHPVSVYLCCGLAGYRSARGRYSNFNPGLALMAGYI